MISNLQPHPPYVITPDGWPAIEMIPDSQYIDVTGDITGIPGVLMCEDVKGMVLDVFKLKAKLFCGKYPGIPLYIVKWKKKKWEMSEVNPTKTKKNRRVVYQS